MDDVQVSKKPSNSPKHYTKDISSEKETKSSQETPDVQLPSLHSLNTMAEVAETVLASEPSLSKGVSSPSPNIQNVNEPTTDPSLMNMRPIPSPPMSSTYGVLPPSMLFPYVPRYSQSMNQQVTALPVQYPPFPLSSQYGSIIPPMKIQSRASTLADHGENISTSPSTLPSSGPQESSLPTTSVKSNNNESPSMLSSTSSPRRQSLESLIMVGAVMNFQSLRQKEIFLIPKIDVSSTMSLKDVVETLSKKDFQNLKAKFRVFHVRDAAKWTFYIEVSYDMISSFV
jgi:hypothetical protein